MTSVMVLVGLTPLWLAPSHRVHFLTTSLVLHANYTVTEIEHFKIEYLHLHLSTQKALFSYLPVPSQDSWSDILSPLPRNMTGLHLIPVRTVNWQEKIIMWNGRIWRMNYKRWAYSRQLQSNKICNSVQNLILG